MKFIFWYKRQKSGWYMYDIQWNRNDLSSEPIKLFGNNGNIYRKFLLFLFFYQKQPCFHSKFYSKQWRTKVIPMKNYIIYDCLFVKVINIKVILLYNLVFNKDCIYQQSNWFLPTHPQWIKRKKNENPLNCMKHFFGKDDQKKYEKIAS